MSQHHIIDFKIGLHQQIDRILKIHTAIINFFGIQMDLYQFWDSSRGLGKEALDIEIVHIRRLELHCTTSHWPSSPMKLDPTFRVLLNHSAPPSHSL